MSSLGDAYRAAHAQDSSLGYGRFHVAQVFAPGRTELAGNHVDHQNGVVLTGTLELGIRGQAAENGTDTVHIESSGYPAFEILLDDVRTGRIELDWTPGTPIDANQSRALAIGVLAGFIHAGFDMRGFDLQLEADLPSGSGLSSSAAFELAIASVCNLFFSGNRIPPEKLALLAQSAERDYLGKPCGLMDQMAIACGGLVAMDFANPTNPQVKSIAAKFASFGYDLCLVNVGADHSAFVEEYAQVPADMHNVASFLGGTTLRDVPRATLYDHLDDVRFALGDGALLRAMHYYRECDLTRKRIQALEQGDFDAFCAAQPCLRPRRPSICRTYPSQAPTNLPWWPWPLQTKSSTTWHGPTPISPGASHPSPARSEAGTHLQANPKSAAASAASTVEVSGVPYKFSSPESKPPSLPLLWMDTLAQAHVLSPV